MKIETKENKHNISHTHIYIKLILIISVLLLIVCSIWYHYPINKVMNINACSLEGDTVKININIRYYRYFFKPTYAGGIIIFNGIEYVDLKAKGLDSYENNNFITNLKLKIDGFKYDYFVNSSLLAPDFVHDSVLLLYNSNNNYYSFLYTNSNIEEKNGIIYYMPATTVKEAKDIQINALK